MSFTSLPNEIAQEVLSYLPIRSLHSFALTSRASSALARTSLRTLALGVFHTRVSGLISFMDVPTRSSASHAVSITLPKNDAKTRQQIVRNQNAVAAKVLREHGQSIRELELVLWELEKPLADALAAMPNLRRLSLRFDHSHTRHAGLDRTYWDVAPTGTVWNLLSTSCEGENLLGRLESLTLERSGINDYQLEQLIERNPNLTELRLQKCLALTEDFFEYLGRSPIAKRLKKLYITSNDSDAMDERVLKHISKLSALKLLSFHSCRNLDNDDIKFLNEKEWRIRNVILPHSADSPREVTIEVDPAYK